jgi:hypothetical protein
VAVAAAAAAADAEDSDDSTEKDGEDQPPSEVHQPAFSDEQLARTARNRQAALAKREAKSPR